MPLTDRPLIDSVTKYQIDSLVGDEGDEWVKFEYTQMWGDPDPMDTYEGALSVIEFFRGMIGHPSFNCRALRLVEVVTTRRVVRAYSEDGELPLS